MIWVSSTTRCHALVATFHSISTHSLLLLFGVSHSVWYALLSSQVGLPWFIPPSEILMCVGPAPNSISGSSLRGVITRFFVDSSNCYSFLRARRFQHKARHPPKSCRTFRKICDRLHHRTGVGRPAQGVLPDQASNVYNLNLKLRSRPPA